MRIDVLTLFPGMIEGPIAESMIRIAREKGIVSIHVHDLRRWTRDRHRTADDKPYGGGAGMVLKVEPVYRALEAILPGKCTGKKTDREALVILMTPQGTRYTQGRARRLAKRRHLVLICGHYEGFDERIRGLVDMELSAGDFITTCGEIPASLVIDSVVRLLPGALGDPESLTTETFENDLLEYPHYTRPSAYKGMFVPEVLLSGDHKRIAAWRRKESLKRTKQKRPDLYKHAIKHKGGVRE